MKNNIMILFVAGASLLAGCDQETPVVAPEMSDLQSTLDNGAADVYEQSLDKIETGLFAGIESHDATATLIPITGEFDFSPVHIIKPGKSWVDDQGILHIRNQKYSSPTTGDVEGTTLIKFNGDIEAATGNGPVWGSFKFEGACNVCDPPGLEGMFKGDYIGKSTFGSLSASGFAKGKQGFKKMVMALATQQTTPPGTEPVLVAYTGDVLDLRKKK